MSEYDFLYKIMYEMTTVFESSTNPNDLILGLKQIFRSFCVLDEFTIYTYDPVSKTMKNFAKPWEIIPNGKIADEINEKFAEFSKQQNFIKKDKNIFFPLYKQGKITGVVKLECVIEEEILNKILPLLIRQISLAVVHLQYFEGVKNNAKFYETVRNIMKITETQYDLNYVLPIMGEMIDGFIREHLIYIFMKKSGKNEYRLIWPNKCLIKDIDKHLKEIKERKSIIEDNGKMCIFPLTENKKPIGAIVAYNPTDNLNKGEIEYLEQLSIQASTTVSKAKEYMTILQNATLDALTGLNNRHMFHQRLKEATSNAKRQKTELCCIMTDIDFFKKVNDTYGHAVGDLVLKTVAKTIKKGLREYDIPSRYGGEEFAILLPNTTLDEASMVAERLRKQVEKKKINIEDYNIDGVSEISVSISLGVSRYDEKTMKDSEDLYKKADTGLYQAKESGRNRAVVAN